MISEQPLPGQGEPATGAIRAATQARSHARSGEPTDGGDPACWARLVCQECGAVISEGHRAGCSYSSHPAGPLRTGS